MDLDNLVHLTYERMGFEHLAHHSISESYIMFLVIKKILVI